MRTSLSMTIGHDACDPTSDPPDCTLDLSPLILHALKDFFGSEPEIIERRSDHMIVTMRVEIVDPTPYRVED